MTGYQLLLLVLTLAAVIFGVVHTLTQSATRWLGASVSCVAGYLLVLVLHGL